MKNIRLISGKPLIAYTIIEAKKSKYIDNLIVSTDDNEIAEISKKYGAEVPFLRPKKLATDKAKTVDVLIHAVKFLERTNKFIPYIVVLLEPTSPLRTLEDINGGIKKHLGTDVDSVVSVVRCGNHHPLKAKIIENDTLKDYIFEEKEITRSQNLPSVYFRNGAFYSVKRDVLMNEHRLYGKVTRPYIMPPERSVDINDEMDFKLAEALLKGK